MSITKPEQRLRVPKLDSLLGHKFPALDDGFVRVVDYMGGDAAIVQAARVSYGMGTKKVHEDRGLVRYLMRHGHTTPFEMCEIKFHLRVPMDCWRQWIRHRTANVNEYSTRYSVAIDAAQRTSPNQWRRQAVSNRQGSAGFLDLPAGTALSERENDLQRSARLVYEERLSKGVAREQARKDLPLSTYTEAYWKIDLHNLFHFLQLRTHPTAQAEIREYASLIGREIVALWCPLAWDAFVDYRVDSVFLSAAELEILRLLLKGDTAGSIQLATARGLVTFREGRIVPNRERTELEEKLRSLGVAIPW